jgi:hypothetical protein
MIDVRRAGTSALLATVAFIVLLGARPLPVDRIVAGYALVLAAIALGALTAAVGAARGRPQSRFEQELKREQIPPSRPAELVRVERELTLSSSNAGHLHSRLRPLLQEIVAVRLDIDLDRRPDVARARLDDATWELVRPDAPPPLDRSAPGLPLRRIRWMIDTLERL